VMPAAPYTGAGGTLFDAAVEVRGDRLVFLGADIAAGLETGAVDVLDDDAVADGARRRRGLLRALLVVLRELIGGAARPGPVKRRAATERDRGKHRARYGEDRAILTHVPPSPYTTSSSASFAAVGRPVSGSQPAIS